MQAGDDALNTCAAHHPCVPFVPLDRDESRARAVTEHGHHQDHGPIIAVGIITVSDSSARGEREDLGGPAIREVMLGAGAAIDRGAPPPRLLNHMRELGKARNRQLSGEESR